MDKLIAEINDVLLDFINVDRTAHVLDGTEYWALEKIASIMSQYKYQAKPKVEEYDFTD